MRASRFRSPPMLARARPRGNAPDRQCGLITGADIWALGRYIPHRPARPGICCWPEGREERMTGTTRSSEGLDVRRRKLLFRCWHRGMRELDLIMGRFADNAIDDLTADDLAEFERLIEVPDRELLAWVTGEIDVPAAHDTALFHRLRDFNRRGEGAR